MASPAIDAGVPLKMTIHARFHMENTCRAHPLHLCDLSVTALATHIG